MKLLGGKGRGFGTLEWTGFCTAKGTSRTVKGGVWTGAANYPQTGVSEERTRNSEAQLQKIIKSGQMT